MVFTQKNQLKQSCKLLIKSSKKLEVVPILTLNTLNSFSLVYVKILNFMAKELKIWEEKEPLKI